MLIVTWYLQLKKISKTHNSTKLIFMVYKHCVTEKEYGIAFCCFSITDTCWNHASARTRALKNIGGSKDFLTGDNLHHWLCESDSEREREIARSLRSIFIDDLTLCFLTITIAADWEIQLWEAIVLFHTYHIEHLFLLLIFSGLLTWLQWTMFVAVVFSFFMTFFLSFRAISLSFFSLVWH